MRKALVIAADYDNRVYSQGVYSHENQASTAISILNPGPGKRLLDVGCGGGHFLRLADENHIKTYGIDLSKTAIRTAKRVSPNSKLVIGDAEHLSFKSRYFDYVTCLGSLEHFPDMGKSIKEMARVLKSNGTVCIYVPNKFFVGDIFRKKQTHGQKLERFLSYKEWKDTFENYGLEVVRTYKDNPTIPADGRIAGYENEAGPFLEFKKGAYTAIRHFIPLNLSFGFYFICKVSQN